jgi:hypothetical protein
VSEKLPGSYCNFGLNDLVTRTLGIRFWIEHRKDSAFLIGVKEPNPRDGCPYAAYDCKNKEDNALNSDEKNHDGTNRTNG